jgi:hypothetical protein
MDENPGVHNGYLVRHQRGGGSFCWSNHASRIHADIKMVNLGVHTGWLHGLNIILL